MNIRYNKSSEDQRYKRKGEKQIKIYIQCALNRENSGLQLNKYTVPTKMLSQVPSDIKALSTELQIRFVLPLETLPATIYHNLHLSCSLSPTYSLFYFLETELLFGYHLQQQLLFECL